jgi:hypothetical protein
MAGSDDKKYNIPVNLEIEKKPPVERGSHTSKLSEKQKI